MCVCVCARAWNTPAQACWSLYQFSAPAGEWSYHNIDTHIWARAVRFLGALFTRRCCWQPEGFHWQESLVLSQHCNPQARHLVVSWSTFPKWVSITSHHRPAWHLQGCHRCCHPQFDSAGCSMPNGMNSSTAITLFDLCSQSTSPKLPPCHFQSPSKGPPMVIICCLSGSMHNTVSALLGIQYLRPVWGFSRFDVVCRLLQAAHAQSQIFLGISSSGWRIPMIYQLIP